jgi:hypothetical protein
MILDDLYLFLDHKELVIWNNDPFWNMALATSFWEEDLRLVLPLTVSVP